MTAVATGSFHRWLAARGQLGDQHKVPRASNQRDVIEAVLAAVGAESRTASRFRADRLAQATPLTSVRYVISRLIRP